MDLKLVNPQAMTMLASYGVTPERSKELMAQVEKIIKGYESKIATVPMATLMTEVAKPCKTEEELVCIVVAVTKYMLRNYTPIALS